jgi:hypothetical protein
VKAAFNKMQKNQNVLIVKLITGSLLAISVAGFFYFETSFLLRFIVVLFSVASFSWAIFQKTDKPPLSSRREILVLLVLYLGFFTLYNLLYGLGIPLYFVMVAVWLLVSAMFYILLTLDSIDTLLTHPLFWVFTSLVGLVILEVFLSLSFWPIDPKVKSLILVIIYYLVTNLIYLYTHNVLNFKRISGFLIVSFIILGLMVLNIWLGLKGGS